MDSSILEFGRPLMQTGVSVYNQKQNGKQLGPDETVHYELSHLDLHCL